MRARGFVAAVLAAFLAGSVLGPRQIWAGPFDWLSPEWWQSRPVTVYAPVVSPASTTVYSPITTAPTVLPAATPIAPTTTVTYAPAAQTCYYAPETRYRWVYGRMPVTSYRPVNVVDPCTGAVTTTYQPVTRLTLLPWLHREPYTTYRLVCTPVVPTAVAETSYVICDPCAPAGEVITSTTTIPSGTCPPGCVPAPGTGVTPGPTEAPAPTTPNSGYSPPQTFKGGTSSATGASSSSSPYSVQRPAQNGAPAGSPAPSLAPQNGSGTSAVPPAGTQPQLFQPSSKSANWDGQGTSTRLAHHVSFERRAANPATASGLKWDKPQAPLPDAPSGDGWRPARP